MHTRYARRRLRPAASLTKPVKAGWHSNTTHSNLIPAAVNLPVPASAGVVA